jgi:hypothetical protein
MNDIFCQDMIIIARPQNPTRYGDCAIFQRLKLMSFRVEIKARQSYLTSSLKEVQIGHENHA